MKRIVLYKTCPICYEESEVVVLCTEEQHKDYTKNYMGLIRPNKPIQEIFPNLDRVKRETIKSGTCEECQRAIF